MLAGLATSSMTAAVARSQATGSAAQDTARGSDEDDAGSGSARPLVAPAEPKARLMWLHDRVISAIAARPALASAKIAVSVIDLATGNEMIAHEADRAMSLASTAKLLTSTAALSVLGGGFRWRTAVYGAEPDAKGAVAGALHVKGRGDPMLGMPDLRALAAELVARGVRSVEGVAIDGSYFDDVVEPPRFDDQPGETAYFRAPVASLGSRAARSPWSWSPNRPARRA